MNTVVVDVTESEFEQVVVEGSRTRPVVVDFWAEWCGPCRQLSPILEDMSVRFDGQVDVVKVDVDSNPGLSQQFGVQGIPAVKAFAGGQMVSEFTGLQPEPVVEQFFAALLPSPAEQLVERARAGDGDPDVLLREALALEVDHPGAAIELAQRLIDADQRGEASQVLARARPTSEVEQLKARLSLSKGEDDLEDLQALNQSSDDAAGVRLGRAYAAQGRHAEAIDVLLPAVSIPATRDDARDVLLEVFTVLGADHPLVKDARPKLATALF